MLDRVRANCLKHLEALDKGCKLGLAACMYGMEGSYLVGLSSMLAASR